MHYADFAKLNNTIVGIFLYTVYWFYPYLLSLLPGSLLFSEGSRRESAKNTVGTIILEHVDENLNGVSTDVIITAFSMDGWAP